MESSYDEGQQHRLHALKLSSAGKNIKNEHFDDVRHKVVGWAGGDKQKKNVPLVTKQIVHTNYIYISSLLHSMCTLRFIRVLCVGV